MIQSSRETLMLLHLLYLLQWGQFNDFLNFKFIFFANFIFLNLEKHFFSCVNGEKNMFFGV